MSKKFTSKKKRKIKIHYILYIIIIFIIYQLTFSQLMNNKLASSNEEFLKYLLNDANHHQIYEKNNQRVVKRVSTMLSHMDLSRPLTILQTSIGYEQKNNNELVYNDKYKGEELQHITEYIKDPHPTNEKEPVVYIYNTHQLENYDAKNLEIYNITPNVMMASYLLKENLNKLGISTIVEDSNITEFLKMNNWDYSESYKASRFYILDTINKYKSTKLFIDLHRDSINKKASTVSIDQKDYAKILFIVGLEYDNYEPTLNLAKKINDITNSQYPGLSRGVITKSGEGVDGVYNQDLHENMLLIECGGKENNIEEVMNTMTALSKIIKEYMGAQ
ncbi:MAG: stage II sporulation protein P [Bacilli bacterium]